MKTIRVKKIWAGIGLMCKDAKTTDGSVAYRSVIVDRTGVDPRACSNNEFDFTISFEPFEKARRVFFNAQSSAERSHYSMVAAGLKKRSDSDFICVPYLKKFLGRVPNNKEAIYYKLTPVK